MSDFDLTIILPAYNVASYITEAIESILNVARISFLCEIIVVNDGSSDETRNTVVRNFGGLSNVILMDQRNQGSGAARNAGFDRARGKYVLFMDPDDTLLPDRLWELWKKIQRLDFEPDMVIFGMEVLRRTTGKVETLPFQIPEKTYQRNVELQADLYAHHQQMTYTPPWNKLIRRDFLRSHRELRFPNQRTGQDVLFAIDLWNTVKTAYWDPMPCYLYRLGRVDGASHKRNPQMVADNAVIAQKLLDNAGDTMKMQIFSEMVVSFGMRELRYCVLKNPTFSTFRQFLKASPLRFYLKKVDFKLLPKPRKFQYLTRRIPLLAYLYYKQKL